MATGGAMLEQTSEVLAQQILWQELEEAADLPEEADLSNLYLMLDQAIALVPPQVRFQVAGDAFLQLAKVYAARANALLSGWERSGQPFEPILSAEGLADLLVRQSLRVDLSELVQIPEHKYVYSENPDQTVADDGSVVNFVERAALLKLLEGVPLTAFDPPPNPLDVAHSEPISEWLRAIATWMQQHCCSQSISLVELQQGLELPMVEVWLGLLLGGQYEFNQSGDFYDPRGIWIMPASFGSSTSGISPLD